MKVSDEMIGRALSVWYRGATDRWLPHEMKRMRETLEAAVGDESEPAARKGWGE